MSIDLDPITSGYQLSKINTNFQRIETEFNNNVLRRDGVGVGEDNTMKVNLDMNSFQILNAMVGDLSLDELVSILEGAVDLEADLLDILTQIQNGGGFNIGTYIPTLATLRSVEPSADKQLVFLFRYDTTSFFGGGFFYADFADVTTADDDGTVVVTAGGKRWKRLMLDTSTIEAEWFGVNFSRTNNAPYIKRAADAARKRILRLPRAPDTNNATLKITEPVVFQTDCGIKLRGGGTKSCTVIEANIPAGFETQGALHFPGRSPTNVVQEGFNGIEISNIQLIGNLSKCHGIFLQYQYQATYHQITIEAFDGAGLLLDKCQDSSFNQVNLFNCGRTSGNRALLVDGFDTTKTLFAPIHCVSTLGSDRSNFLRFNDCQFEDHPIAPVVDWQGGINNSFTECHFEYNSAWDITGTDGGAFLRLREGIINFNGGGVAEYRVLRHGSGEIYMDNTRCTPTGVDYTVTGGSSARCKFTKINIHSFLSNLNTSSFKEFDFCTFTADMLVGFPDNRVAFNSCLFQGNLSSNSTSGGLIAATVSDCTILGNVDLGTGSKNWILVGNTVVGNVSFGSQAGYFGPNRVVGTVSQVGVDINHIELNRKLFAGNSPPASGTYAVGDQSRNITPTAGGYIGWVCVTAGSPGVWKGFGVIQA